MDNNINGYFIGKHNYTITVEISIENYSILYQWTICQKQKSSLMSNNLSKIKDTITNELFVGNNRHYYRRILFVGNFDG